MKDYNKHFNVMYNIANHIINNYSSIFNRDIKSFKHKDLEFVRTYYTRSIYCVHNYEFDLELSIIKHNIEYSNIKDIKIFYNNIMESNIRICYNMDTNSAIIVGKEIEKCQYPLSTEDLFNINLSNIPISINTKLLDTMIKLLKNENYCISLNLN